MSTPLSENEHLVKFLREIAEMYRLEDNPRKYAYAGAAQSVSDADFVVTPENCRELKWIGPKICADINELMLESRDWNSPSPLARNPENNDIVAFLWKCAQWALKNDTTGHAWAFRKAVYSIVRTNESLRILDSLCELEFIGPAIETLIRAFYSGSSDYADQRPAYVICQDLEAIVNFLWERGYTRAARALSLEPTVPETRSAYLDVPGMSIAAYNELSDASLGESTAPRALHIHHQPIVNWLWRQGGACTGVHSRNYYCAAKKIANKKKVLANSQDLEKIKYVGEHIRQRMLAEIWGLIDPEDYRHLRRKLWQKSSRPTKRARHN